MRPAGWGAPPRADKRASIEPEGEREAIAQPTGYTCHAVDEEALRPVYGPRARARLTHGGHGGEGGRADGALVFFCQK